jgi:hypothetical protein
VWAHIEYFDGGIIRVFDDASAYGEPYLFSIAFRISDGDPQMIELVGVTRAPTTQQLRAIVTELRSRGIRVRRLRRRQGKDEVKEFE